MLFVDLFSLLHLFACVLVMGLASTSEQIVEQEIFFQSAHATKQANNSISHRVWSNESEITNDNDDNNNAHTTRAKDVSLRALLAVVLLAFLLLLLLAVCSFQIQIFIVVLTHFKLICTY